LKFVEYSICLFRISVIDLLFLTFHVLTVSLLEIFDDAFIDYLFELVEQTRYMHDDTFNYSVIRLIVSLAKLGAGYKLPIRAYRSHSTRNLWSLGLERMNLPQAKRRTQKLQSQKTG
jgi:hypothetical protein